MATRKRTPKKAVGMVIEGKKKVRIGARIDQDLYVLCKIAYSRQGWSMESRMEELMKRDIESMSKNQWFKEMMSSELFMKYVAQAQNDQPGSDSPSDGSDFDSNYLGDGNEQE